MPKLSIFIPVYNESTYVHRLLENVFQEDISPWEKEVIIVNDGSTDDTLKQIRKFQTEYPALTVITTKNQGKGGAVNEAARRATGDVLLIQDADLEYDPADYHIILKEYQHPKRSVVYGSRTLGAKRYTSYHSHVLFYIGGILLTQLMNVLFGTKLTDQSTCYKSWRRELTAGLLEMCPTNGFAFEVEITAFFAKQTKITAVPIRYYPRALHHGKKIRFQDFVSSVATAIRCRLHTSK